MATATDVMKHLVMLAESDETSDLVTNLRLQKLLYYVQGWSLAERGRPMFDDRIEAWATGPAVPPVYGDLKKYGRAGITSAEVGEPKNLSDDERDFIEGVWESYKDHSAASLVRMTHNERPWIEARGGVRDGDHCNAVITNESMAKHFSALSN